MTGRRRLPISTVTVQAAEQRADIPDEIGRRDAVPAGQTLLRSTDAPARDFAWFALCDVSCFPAVPEVFN